MTLGWKILISVLPMMSAVELMILAVLEPLAQTIKLRRE